MVNDNRIHYLEKKLHEIGENEKKKKKKTVLL